MGIRFHTSSNKYPDAWTGKVGHWPLNSTDGATDLINGNNGTLNGGMGYGSSGGREYAVFDGVDDYIQVPHFTGLNFGTGPFSVTFWINTTSSAYDFILTKYAGGGGQLAILLGSATAGHLKLYTWNGSEHSRETSVSVNSGSWVHFAATRDGSGNLNLYVNGSLSNGTLTGGASVDISSSGDLFVGFNNYGPGNYYTGSLSDLRFYNRALSAAEVTVLAQTII